MEVNYIQIFTLLYSIAGIVGFSAFLPTIADLLKGNPSANIKTYLIWSIITVFAFLYGLFVLKDSMFNIVIGSQLIGYMTVLTLRLRLEYFKK